MGVLGLDGVVGVGAGTGAPAGLAIQQFNVTPSTVGQHSPFRPTAEHPGFDEHDPLLDAVGAGLVGVVGVGAEIGSPTGLEPQQSSVTPSVVGQQSPMRPRAAQPGFDEHDPGALGAIGLDGGDGTGAVTGLGAVLQQSRKIPSTVGQQSPSKFSFAHCGFDEQDPLADGFVGTATGLGAVGVSPQQSRKMLSVVGQQSPVNPSAAQPGLEAHDPLTDVGFVGAANGLGTLGVEGVT